MNLLTRLVMVVASAAAIGSGQAGTGDRTYHQGTPLPPTVEQRTDSYTASTHSIPYWFENSFTFTAGAGHQTALAGAVSYPPNGTSAGLMLVTYPTFALYSGTDATGLVLGTVLSANGTPINLPAVIAPADLSARASGMADGRLGGEFQFSVAALPEPADWMLLLSGLVVVAFMARRKTSVISA